MAETERPRGDQDGTVPTNPNAWPHAEFVAWIDRIKTQLELPSDNRLAAYLGVDNTRISGWRSGKHKPSFEILAQVGHALGMRDIRPLWVLAGLCSAADVGMLDEPDQGQGIPAEVRMLLDVLGDRGLPDEDRRSLLRSVEMLAAGAARSLGAGRRSAQG